MTLAVQLRAALEYTRDRLAELATEQEALEFVVAAIQDALTLRDSASATVADEGGGEEAIRSLPISPAAPDAGAVRVERTPADQAGERGIDTRPPLQTPATSVACPECGKLVDPRGLGTHRRHMHGRLAATGPVPCPECGTKMLAHSFQKHRRDVHGGEKRVSSAGPPLVSDLLICPECGKQLKRQGYAPHMSRIHQVRLAAAPRPTPAQRLAARDKSRGNGAPLRSGAHEWLCDRCDARFSSREALAVHRTSHAEQPRGQPVGTSERAYSVGGGE